MKAKFRKTGEIVDVIAYNDNSVRFPAFDFVSYIDSEGVEHPRENGLNYYWDFESISEPEEDHWQDVRERAAIAALQGILTFVGDDTYFQSSLNTTLAKKCVSIANALIEQLKEK